jgi:hypothetical protein
MTAIAGGIILAILALILFGWLLWIVALVITSLIGLAKLSIRARHSRRTDPARL